jgi:hypothetical protein
MTQTNRKFYADSDNRRVDQLPFDIVEAEARQMAATSYDLRTQEDRARAWLAHLAESHGGGFRLWCSDLDFEPANMDDYLHHNEPLNERNQRQLLAHKEEFDQLASNDPRWAELNVLGGVRK